MALKVRKAYRDLVELLAHKVHRDVLVCREQQVHKEQRELTEI
jgi:hypothetical protein